MSSPELQSTLFDSLRCPWVTDGTAFQGFGCPSTPECHYTCASWWVRWSLFLINSRKRGEDGMVIEGTSLIVGDVSPSRISVINCAGWVGNTQIRTAFIFQGQRTHKETDWEDCCWDAKLHKRNSSSFWLFSVVWSWHVWVFCKVCVFCFDYDALRRLNASQF